MRGSEKMWLKIDNSNVWLTGAQLWPEPPHARDKIGHIALLGGRYIVLLFAICIVEKVKVCFFLLLPQSVC